MRPDESAPLVLTALRDLRRRRLALDGAFILSTAVATFALLHWLLTPFVRPAAALSLAALAGLGAAAGLFWRWKGRWSGAAVARCVEAVKPNCRNLVITAEELQRHPERATAWMTDAVTEQASFSIDGLSGAHVVRASPAFGMAMVAALASAAAMFAPPVRDVGRNLAEIATSTAARIRGGPSSLVVLTVRPPAYSKLERQTLTDPARVDVLEGSSVGFTVTGDRSRRVRFGDRALGELTAGGLPIEFVARDGGYFAVESSDGGDPLLIVLSVVPDRAPTVRVEQPARDLLMPDALRTVPVTLSASDDFGLAAFELRYTKISGAGEQFEFVEGVVPVRLERESAREWRGHAGIALPSLQLAPGDSIVYRAVARDARPGAAGLASSDTFFIEIAGPGLVPLDAVGMPPNEDRYALSQQMIVLKIERLQARHRGLSREQVLEEASMIAAEQRSVRANFVFLLGGHVEDEEVEAEQSSEIAEGRLMNTARRDINAAVRDMTRAEQGLTAVELETALIAARAAVNSLQRAFGRNRYFLRTLSGQTRIDPSRRLTGELGTGTGLSRNPADPGVREGDDARALLPDLMSLTNAVREKSVIAPAAVQSLAERALSIDPASSTWQTVSRRLLEVRGALQRPADAQSILNEVSAAVRHEADRGLLSRTPLSTPVSPLRRAWEGRAPR